MRVLLLLYTRMLGSRLEILFLKLKEGVSLMQEVKLQRYGNTTARAWTKWEMMTAHLLPNEENAKRGDDDSFSLAFARIENHYFVNKGFFPTESYLLDNVDKIKHIPTFIVQGRYDVCCPVMSAWDLHKVCLKQILRCRTYG